MNFNNLEGSVFVCKQHNTLIMMKLTFFFMLLIALGFYSCNSSKKSEEVASYVYEEEVIELNDSLKAKIPDWVEEGKICYGLVVLTDKNGKRVIGQPVKAKVVQINENSVKMKALETVNLMKVEGCNELGILKGEVWDEVEGDLYLTREDAIAALKAMNMYQVGDRATVD